MPTIVRKMPYENADSVGIDPIVVTEDEYRIFAHPSLKHWFRAQEGFDTDSGWHCRLTDLPLVKSHANWPTRAVVAAYNDLPAIVIGNATQSLWDGGEDILPEDSFSVVVFGRVGPAENAFLWGNRGGNTSTISNLVMQFSSGGGILTQLYDRGSLTRTTTSSLATYPRAYADGPNLVVSSYDAPSGGLVTRINRGRFVSAVGAATVASGPANSEFHVGEAITGADIQSGAVDGGDVAEILIFYTALMHASNADLLASVEAYIGTRYDMAAP